MKAHLTLALLFLCTLPVFARSGNDIVFNSLNIENGLSHHTVTSIYEDERGYVWIGTREGLNLYNGQDIKVFKSEAGNVNSLRYNRIQKVCGDKNGHIYILGSNGISVYDLHSAKFKVLFQGDVSAITYNRSLYFAQDAGIYKISGSSAKCLHTFDKADIKILTLEMFGNELWVGTDDDGVYVLVEDKEVRHLDIDARVLSFYKDSKGEIWVSTNGKGLYSFANGNWKKHGEINSEVVRDCREDNKGNLWVATFDGLYELPASRKGEIKHYSSGNSPCSLTYPSVTCLHKDSNGNIWAGTYFGGVNYFNPEYQLYTLYEQSETEGEGLSFPVVGKITEDSDGNLWIATENGGVNRFDRKTESFKWYDTGHYPLSDNRIKSLYCDKDVLWIGTHKGLNRLNIKTGAIRQYLPRQGDPTSLPGQIVSDIISYKDSLLIATFNGLCLLDPKSGKCRQVLNKGENAISYATNLHIAKDSTLWIVTGDNFYAHNLKTGTTKKYFKEDNKSADYMRSLSICVFEDSAGDIWSGTWTNGLYKYNRTTDSFEHFVSMKDGLLSDSIFEIIEVAPGELLVSCISGYSVVNTSTKEIKRWTKSSGLPISGFNESSLYQASDGKIFMGSTKGLISFRYNDRNTVKNNKIVLSRLTVNNEEVNPGDGTGILEDDIFYTRKIQLKPKFNVFSIKLTSLNYAHKPQEIYYKLQGHSNEWIEVNNANVLTFSNLRPHTYKLYADYMDALEANMGESDNLLLEIKVIPPFYKSIYAILLYIVLALGIAFYLLRSYLYHVKMEAEVKYEQKRVADNEEKTKFKLDFYSNVSHEFKTPLTIIVGETELLMHDKSALSEKNYKRVQNINRSGILLKELICELLQFRKYDELQIDLHVKEYDLKILMDEIYVYFSPIAEKMNIQLSFKAPEHECKVWCDAPAIRKVIMNLLSNAFKFTPSGGKIEMFLRQENGQSIFGVKDNGCGIKEKDIDKIFDIYYQTAYSGYSSLGSGIGLSLCKSIIEQHHGNIDVSSNYEHGSCFTITLENGNEQFSEEELADTDKGKALPPISALDMAVPHPAGETAMEETVEDNGKETVLIVDDNKDILSLFQDIFQQKYNVIVADNGQKGYTLACTRMPDLIITDVIMPVMSGIELCSKLKNDFATCHIPVILLTADSLKVNEIDGLYIGADDYIHKPFSPEMLEAKCKSLLKNRRMLREKYIQNPNSRAAEELATNDIDKQFLQKVSQIIDDNLDNAGFNINQFARELCLSRTGLFNKVKALTGETPNALIMKARLNHGAELLKRRKDLNVGDIADMVGFNSVAYFSKCFSDKYKMSPQAYRKRPF